MSVGIWTAKLPQYLKQHRKAVGLNQAELGRLLGHKDGAMVNAWEAGTRVPSFEMALEVARHLGINPIQLVGEEVRPPSGSHITNNVVNGTHHKVYQHVEGLMVTVAQVQEIVQQVVRDELTLGRALLLEEIRGVLREAVREADDEGGGPPAGEE